MVKKLVGAHLIGRTVHRNGLLRTRLVRRNSPAAPCWIMCIVSMPAMTIRALQKDLNPSIGRVIRLMAR